jgi:glucan phosphoethanolaminetransferase (alkaline phosphatase superfamily)
MKSDLNKHFLKTILLAAIVGSLINLAIDSYNHSTFDTYIISDIIISIVMLSAYFIYKVHKNDIFITIFIVVLILPVLVYMFFYSSGYLMGLHITVIIVLGFLCALILTESLRLYFLGSILVVLIALLALQILHINKFNYHSNPSVGTILGTGLPYIVVYLIIVLSSSTLKDKFEESNRKLFIKNNEVKDINKRIQSQNEELEAQKEELNSINNYLEAEVSKRTENIKLKNEQLAIYSFQNAHNVRGSLARILGLLYLNNVNAEVSKDELLKMIEKEAKEMDVILRHISDDLYFKMDK